MDDIMRIIIIIVYACNGEVDTVLLLIMYCHIFPVVRAQHCNDATILAGR